MILSRNTELVVGAETNLPYLACLPAKEIYPILVLTSVFIPTPLSINTLTFRIVAYFNCTLYFYYTQQTSRFAFAGIGSSIHLFTVTGLVPKGAYLYGETTPNSKVAKNNILTPEGIPTAAYVPKDNNLFVVGLDVSICRRYIPFSFFML